MSKAWQPRNFEEACLRNAGRRKFHMRRRRERAERIIRLLEVLNAVSELRESAYGWLPSTAEAIKKSKATASRDLALARRMHGQFARMFGRNFDPQHDCVKWSWDWAHYGFRTRESLSAGHRKPVGRFPFNTRDPYTHEEAFCGFSPQSWQVSESLPSGWSPRDLGAALKLIQRIGR